MTSALAPASWRLLALLAISASIRPVIASVPPLSLDIQASLGFNDAMIGALTTIPTVCMAIFALVIPRLVRRHGIGWLTVGGLAAITIALALRWWSSSWGGVLFLTALLAGVGIAVGAGVTPSFVREWFPERVMRVSSYTTATFMAGAAIAAAVTVPLAQWWGSWPAALTVWAIPAFLATVAWAVVALRRRESADRSEFVMRLPWRSRTAWFLAAFLAVNSVAFYILLAWMAPSYDERGWTQAEGGYLFGFFSLLQVVGAIAIPRITSRLADRRPLFIVLVLISTGVVLLMGVAPEWMTWPVVAVAGIGLGGVFSVGMALLPELATDAHDAAGLTAMALFVAYAAAAVGPLAIGALLDAGVTWTSVFAIAAVFTLAQLVGLGPLQRARAGRGSRAPLGSG